MKKGEFANSRILAVEDDRICATLIKTSLNNMCTVDIAEDGESALELIRKNNYDLILMDIMLPGKNGIEILGEIKSYNGYENIPIAAVTASVMKFAREYFLEKGFVNYLCKPFEPVKLRELVMDCLTNYTPSPAPKPMRHSH